MQPIEIAVIVISVLVVVSVFGNWLYKKITHKDTGCSGCGGCSGCSSCGSCSSCTTEKKEEDK